MIIDSHQHFWQVGRFDYPWMKPDDPVLHRDYLPQQLAPILKQCGVAKTVVVQASNSLAETHWLLELAQRHDFIAGVVGWVDLTKPTMGEDLKVLKDNPKFKGVRHLVEREPAENWLVQPSVIKGLHVLERYNVRFDLLVQTRHLKHVKSMAQQCSNLEMIIDHMAKPPIASREISQWAMGIKQFRPIGNVSCKFSGLVTEANHKSWTKEDLRPYIEQALETFGSGRLLFGSDWPVCLLAGSYEKVLETFQSLLSDLTQEERDRIFHTNARDFYRLPLNA